MLKCYGIAIVLVAMVTSACDRSAAPKADSPRATKITVFAAASTTDVMRQIGASYENRTGVKVDFSFDSSSTLAKQIKAGGPAEVFLSADQKWMDDVAAAGAIQEDSRRDLLTNTLVLIAPKDKTFEARMTRDFDFAKSLPGVRRIAVGDPTHVPAGRYAKQSLEWLGWLTSLEPRLVPAADARAALRLVEIGEADAGIVYSTDAKPSEKVRVIAECPKESHEAIRYPVALCANASPEAEAFVHQLIKPDSIRIFEAAGFGVMGPDGAK